MINKLVSKFKRFYAFNELLKQLVVRDVKLKYRRSYLGYLWSVLNPLMLMGVLVFVFSNIFRSNIPNFPLYLLTGQIIFNFMVEATNMSVGSITGNAALLKKTYVPKYVFTISKVGSSLVNLVFSLGALLLVMIVTKADFSLALIFFPIVIFQVFVFSLGVGLFLAAVTVFFRDVQYLWGVFISMWMYCTPIFYPVSIIPEKYLFYYKALNPMYLYVEQFRNIILSATFPDLKLILAGFAVAFIALIFGAWYFNKKQDEFILYI